jgi:hypothetical protein
MDMNVFEGPEGVKEDGTGATFGFNDINKIPNFTKTYNDWIAGESDKYKSDTDRANDYKEYIRTAIAQQGIIDAGDAFVEETDNSESIDLGVDLKIGMKDVDNGYKENQVNIQNVLNTLNKPIKGK